MKRLDSDLPTNMTATKETPAANPLPYALVPGVLAVSAILVVFITAGLLALAFGWSVKIPLAAAGGIALALFLIMAFRVELIPYSVEKITNHDWNHDGYVGEPPPPPEPWRIILEKDSGGELWLNFDSEELRQKAQLVAAFMLNGTPFSEQALSGTGRPLTRSEFYTLRDLFMFHGLLEWKDAKHHTLGVQWTPPGRSMIRKLAEGSTTPALIPGTRGPEYAIPARAGQGDE